MHPQLTLQFDQQNSMTFESFFCGPNEVLCEKLKEICLGHTSERQILFWGPADCGKSHLLTACCQAASDKGYRIAYLPGSLISSSAVEGLGELDLVCVDDVHDLPATRDCELALFQLINDIRDAGSKLLMSSRRAPPAMEIALPDLVTRLAWGAVFSMQPLSDAEVRECLQNICKHHGLQLSNEVLDYLLSHFPRDVATQSRQLRRLSQASLQAQRHITIPLVREVLMVSEQTAMNFD